MTDRTPGGGLRERLAEALRKAAYVCPGDGCPHSEDECGENEPIVMAAAAVIDGIPEAMYIDGEVTAIADAVLPVVEAETATLRERAEEAERERETAREALDAAAIVIASLRDQRDEQRQRADTAERRAEHFEEHAAQVDADLGIETQRAETAERQRDEALAAVADEQQRADERRTELLEERDEALNALADAERQARERAADELFQRFQRMREEGDHDMRTALHHVRDVLRSEP